MPLYEYQCAECDRDFEEFVRSMNSAVEVKCPECGSDLVRRKVSLFAAKVSMGGGVYAPAGSCAPSGGG